MPEGGTNRFDAPRMHYCIDTTGTYDGLFDGEDILLSAGLAWNNSGPTFNLHVPDLPNRVLVDSGGFQATTAWDLSYPYSVRDLFEWAAEIGADEVALPDFACEPELHDTTPEERVTRTVEKHCQALDVFQAEPWPFEVLPVLQGWEPDDYRRCARLFERHDLVRDRMAIGTVCKRDDPSKIGEVLDACEDVLGYRRWHLFGLTLNGWKNSRLWGRFASSDTSAWNYRAESKAHKKRLFRAYREKVNQYGRAIEEQTTLATDGGKYSTDTDRNEEGSA
ncbi:deazapurine DNA modification protein DpdA family protein [Halorussus halobius]|uniref:deazapurine DNA modification protein DpdA family protein n=1 Tax=Halorussus halobius TaxID=1710537 RepID=UPI001093159C|nr:hypothetical protein [Halorussus halobius]